MQGEAGSYTTKILSAKKNRIWQNREIFYPRKFWLYGNNSPTVGSTSQRLVVLLLGKPDAAQKVSFYQVGSVYPSSLDYY